MADYTWPETLPQSPSMDGLKEQPPETTIRTEMDAGPPKIRRRFTAAPRSFPMSMIMTKAQVVIFDDFYLNTLDGGSKRFNWVSPRTEGTGEFLFSTKPGPAYQMVDLNNYRVVFEVALMP